MTLQLASTRKFAGSVLVGAVLYLLATMISGVLLSRLPLQAPQMPPGLDQGGAIVGLALGSLCVLLAMALLSAATRGSRAGRALRLFLFAYVTWGVNTSIEAVVFSTLGGGLHMALGFLLPCALAALWISRLGPSAAPAGEREGFWPRRSPGGWAFRLFLAYLAFPVIYWTFGMMIVPFVKVYYADPDALVRLPPALVVLRTQLIRSALFLGAVLPLLAAWTGSRRRLGWTLGLAYFLLVGLAGLIQAPFLPRTMRLVHGVEIFADSLVYGWVLAMLLYRPEAPAR